ncbi:MAG: hypothetical protein M1825_002226 [Sarcosagium campestre]|nr:MAG: hypothetical protein M1825_002226 [Sarcosagium campestre]
MIKIAIAGTGGLAQSIADFLTQDTPHQFIFLSRGTNSVLTGNGYQVHTVDYHSKDSLQYALTGIDTVISTVTGNAQLRLIDAAVVVGVRRFAPAEFEGPPAARLYGDILDRGRTAALTRLRSVAAHIESTAFVCGIFYERFLPGGMQSCGIGAGSGLGAEGDYLMNLRSYSAQIPHHDATGLAPSICLTSARDVARFVVRALDLPYWPDELHVRGETMTVGDLVATAERIRGTPFEKSSFGHDALHDHLEYARHAQDYGEQCRMQALIATLEGRYVFANPPSSSLIDVLPLPFESWLQHQWIGQ